MGRAAVEVPGELLRSVLGIPDSAEASEFVVFALLHDPGEGRKSLKFPPGTEILDARADLACDLVTITLEHPDLPRNPYGVPPPRATAVYKRKGKVAVFVKWEVVL